MKSSSACQVESTHAPHAQIAVRAAMVSSQDAEVLCLSAATVPGLVELAESVRSDAAGASAAEVADLAASLHPLNHPTLPVRAAVVASTPEELTRRLDALVERLRAAPARGKALLDRGEGLAIGDGIDGCSLGFVFPGQGAQRLHMARGLVERFEWARALVDDADGWAREVGTEGLSSRIYPDPDRQVSREERERASAELRRTEYAQPAIVLASLLWLRYLERLGLSAECVMGHSLGELTAFHAAGAYDAKALIQLATLRGQLMAGTDPAVSGGMLSLACDRERAELLVEEVDVAGPLVVANVNAPSQTVVSGALAAIASLEDLARARGVAAQRLPVSNAFHSPLVASAAGKLRKLTRIPRWPTRIDRTLISSCDGHRVSADVDLREHFAEQIVKPVDFVGAVEALRERCDLLVEVGPGGTLSHLVAQQRAGRALPAWPVERDAESFADLCWLVGAAHVHGKAIAWDELYASRVIRPFTAAKDLRFIVNPCERPLAGDGERPLATDAQRADLAAEVLPEAPKDGRDQPTTSSVAAPAAAALETREARQDRAPARDEALEAAGADPRLRSRFRATFKDVTTSLHGLQFDTFADWMGRARELATVSIAKELVADFASGRWGMVTNRSDIRVVGKVECLDLVEGRLRVARAYGKCGSSVDLQFDWVRIDEDGSERVVAFSDMTTTWVEILGPGHVEVRPFPAYMQRLIDSYLEASGGGAPAAGEGARRAGPAPGVEASLGEAIYLAPDASRAEPELARATFDTASAESNLVGNIYYASYYHWQARLLDRAFHGIAPALPPGARGGELTCVHGAIAHLREAMPFDRIEVVMALRAIHRRGVKLHFEFHRIADDGQRVKLAVGEYGGVWTDAATGAPADLPSSYVASFTGRRAVAA